jgi:hypothetical protein
VESLPDDEALQTAFVSFRRSCPLRHHQIKVCLKESSKKVKSHPCRLSTSLMERDRKPAPPLRVLLNGGSDAFAIKQSQSLKYDWRCERMIDFSNSSTMTLLPQEQLLPRQRSLLEGIS